MGPKLLRILKCLNMLTIWVYGGIAELGFAQIRTPKRRVKTQSVSRKIHCSVRDQFRLFRYFPGHNFNRVTEGKH